LASCGWQSGCALTVCRHPTSPALPDSWRPSSMCTRHVSSRPRRRPRYWALHGVAMPPLNLAGDRRDLAANTTWFGARIRFLIWQRCVELEESAARGLGNTNWALPEFLGHT
jgi:hypothetical protein